MFINVYLSHLFCFLCIYSSSAALKTTCLCPNLVSQLTLCHEATSAITTECVNLTSCHRGRGSWTLNACEYMHYGCILLFISHLHLPAPFSVKGSLLLSHVVNSTCFCFTTVVPFGGVKVSLGMGIGIDNGLLVLSDAHLHHAGVLCVPQLWLL
jgi:hypothetical protein